MAHVARVCGGPLGLLPILFAVIWRGPRLGHSRGGALYYLALGVYHTTFRAAKKKKKKKKKRKRKKYSCADKRREQARYIGRALRESVQWWTRSGSYNQLMNRWGVQGRDGKSKRTSRQKKHRPSL